MGTLHAALEWAQRGFPVFPLKENTREPALEGNWLGHASSDPAVIRALWTDPVTGIERNYNIGCVCTGMVVIDIDVKKGKQGYQEYQALNGSYDTLVVQTTTGGFHCYFRGPDSSNVKISDAIDIRSHNGYVVAPGSSIDGSYYKIINNAPMAQIPEHLERLLTPVYHRAEGVEEFLDTEASIEAARRYLETAPPAIEGQRGDETTFKVAARLVRELALSVTRAYELMRDVYNPRCMPPWSEDELWIKVQNAESYGSADHGRITAEHLFAQVGEIPVPPTVFASASLDFGNALAPVFVKPREWVMQNFLIRGMSSMIAAAGSSGKSTISLVIAAHLALGLDFGGYKTTKPVRSIIYNGEDDIMEQSRRLWAICMEYELDYAAVKENIMLISAREFKMQLVNGIKGSWPTRNDIVVNQLIEKCRENDVGLLVLDPLVRIHTCNEGDNVEMDFVMDTINDVAYRANMAVLILHHTSKSLMRQEERVGNMDISRGASAIVNATRVAMTLLNAGNEDLLSYGIQDAEKNMYVRMDDAKMNLSLASDNAVWFKKVGVRIPSGDFVGVLKTTTLERSTQHIRILTANALIPHFEATGTASIAMATAVSLVKTNEPLMRNKTDQEVRKCIEAYFSTPLEVRGRTIECKREGKDIKQATIVYY